MNFSNLLIVCSVSTARSKMAEGFFRDFFIRNGMDVSVSSGGIASNARDGMLISLDAKLVMKEIGIILSDNAVSIDLKKRPELINKADLILTLTEKHKKEVLKYNNSSDNKVQTLREFAGESGDIEDPSMKGVEGFRKSRDEINRCIFKGLKKSILPKKFEVDGNDIKKRNWLIYATIGTAITAIPLYFLFKFVIIKGFDAFQGEILTLVISGLLIITGIVLLTFRSKFGIKTIDTVSDRDLIRDSSISGLIQGIAILPGISRSGFTVSTILFEKYNQDQSLKLSFLMSVPVALASIGMDIIFGEGSVFGTIDLFTILIITAVSFIVGYFSMELLLRIARKINFSYFCILYGVVSFVIIVPFMFFG